MALATKAAGKTRPGPSARIAPDVATTTMMVRIAAAASTAGSRVTWKLERKSASRVAFPPTWWAIMATAASMAAQIPASALGSRLLTVVPGSPPGAHGSSPMRRRKRGYLGSERRWSNWAPTLRSSSCEERSW